MRLLDLISQGRSARVVAGDGAVLPGADRFANEIRVCPLRFVLSDDLAQCATQLAYAEGDRLNACLDLLHVPAQSLWIEWADAPRQHALEEIPTLAVRSGTNVQRAGVLIRSAPNGRSGQFRTFWSAHDDSAWLSPVITEFNLDGHPSAAPTTAADWPGPVLVRLEDEPAVDELLTHVCCRVDAEWARYYRECGATDKDRYDVLRGCLSGCAYDTPMLFALFLLLGARDLLPRREVRHDRLNRVRRRRGKPALLEHVEVSAPIGVKIPDGSVPGAESVRLSPRLHHVRGHLVRRGVSVYWRSPHLRGSGRLGEIRTRTVTLSFANR